MKTTVRALLLATALAGTLAAPAAAQFEDPEQRSNTQGFSLGLFLSSAAADMEDTDEVEAGRGLSLQAGYGFNQNLSLFTKISAALISSEGFVDDQYALAHFDLGLRYSFGGTGSALRPFLQGAYSGRGASFDLGSEGQLDTRGAGFTGGVGLEYFVSPKLAIEGGFSYTVGELDEGRLDGSEWVDLEDASIELNSGRLDLGISWHP
jgi:opacity protein-like surface antigen